MRRHDSLIRNFYYAFANKDYRFMQKCYHPSAEFSDPVFHLLKGQEILAMWHMLCEGGKDLQVHAGTIAVYDHTVKCDWKAVYTFAPTKRIVHNLVRAEFILQDERIIRHIDYFNLWRWSAMALGTSGHLLGWTPWMQKRIRQNVRRFLERFIEQHPEYQA